jgi:hypothetical protein
MSLERIFAALGAVAVRIHQSGRVGIGVEVAVEGERVLGRASCRPHGIPPGGILGRLADHERQPAKFDPIDRKGSTYLRTLHGDTAGQSVGFVRSPSSPAGAQTRTRRATLGRDNRPEGRSDLFDGRQGF